MSSKSKYDIYISIHKGDPVDFTKYRHTGLWFVSKDGRSNYYFHVVGLKHEFKFEERKNFDPTTSRSFAKSVNVGRTRHSLKSSDLRSLMESVVVSNDDPEFNCQQWIDYALRSLHHAGYITAEEYDTALNGMIDATMEAGDE